VPEHERAILLSVRPRFAQSILAGTKTAEVRRKRPDIKPGTPVIIYATKPVGAVVGTANVERIYGGSPDLLWQEHHEQMEISKREFDEYLHETCTAYVLMLSNARLLTQPLTLDDMRESADFQPPQSYRYVDRSALGSLVNGHPAGPALLALLHH
jgi:predicted transcriptional regulator